MKIGEFESYKGYTGTIEYNYSDNLYFGSLKDIDDSIMYHASDVMKLYEYYIEVVNDYFILK